MQTDQKSDGATPPLPPLFLADPRCTMLRKVLRSIMRKKFSRITKSIDMAGRVSDVEYTGFMASLVYEELLDLCLTESSPEPFLTFMRTMQFFNENLREFNAQKRQTTDSGSDQSPPVSGPDTN